MSGYPGGWGRLLLTLLVAVSAVVAIPAGTVSGAASAAPPADSVQPQQTASLGTATQPLQADEDTDNNTTVLHEDPEEVDGENRLDRLVSYLSGDLNGRIGTSTAQLSQSEYEAAKAALGDEYDDSLTKYVDVDAETGGDGAGDEYRTVGETQREYVDTVREFRETRREYEAAAQANDTERSRELARRLARLAEDGESQSGRLLDAYEGISNTTDGDLDESSTVLSEIQSDISERRDAVVAAEFVETRLVVRSYDREIAFTRPLEVSGTLETANGTPVDTTQARFAVGEQTVQTAVGPDGDFEFTYRPTSVPANASELTVAYQPAPTSVYRQTERTLPVTVSQETATVRTAGLSASEYGYADPISVRATVAVNGTAVPNYPLTAALAGRPLSTATTNESGASTLAGTVPADVSTGSAEVRIGAERDDRAVRVAPATATVSIAAEATTLDVRAQERPDGSILVEGQLTTVEDEPVAGQPITITVANQSLGTATTGASGAYRTTIALPSNVSRENASVTVAFDGGGTNLESATASTRLDLLEASAEDASSSDDGDGAPSEAEWLPFDPATLVWILSGAAVLALVAAGVRYRDGDEAVPEPVVEEAADAAEPDEPAPPEPASPDVSKSALESAADALSAGRPNDAVVTAYGGVRETLAETVDVDSAATHWEFYDRSVAHAGVDREPLEALTKGYEKAAYSGLAVSDDDAESLLADARALIDAETGQ
ncbi:DUF4129 domain-containing protein [Halobellus ordinarius]|uniref:DUF4129 domain-containing protein n=1 Tax=Halobellus ordinarius TaxID=3075120 RepID=UPI0028800424|nr:DUF4129 domain-containing protein [Halobellus sp. ZY16]